MRSIVLASLCNSIQFNSYEKKCLGKIGESATYENAELCKDRISKYNVILMMILMSIISIFEGA